MAITRCILSVVLLLSLVFSASSQEPQETFNVQLTDMNQVKDALVEGYPLRFFADYTKCSRTPVITIPGVDIEEPSDFGTTIDTFRGLRDITGIPIQLTFTATEIIRFPGISEHIIVHNNIEALPDGQVTVTTKYIERRNVTEVATSINDCMLNDGSNDEGVFIYRSTLYEPVALTTYAEIEEAFMSGYTVRYGAIFTRCGEIGIGTDNIGGGIIPLYYLKRGEKIIASVVKFYNSPFALNKYVLDTFKVDIYQNLTMHIAMSAINFDDFSMRYTDESFNCPMTVSDPSQNPPAVVYKMMPKAQAAATTKPNVVTPEPTAKAGSSTVKPVSFSVLLSMLATILYIFN